MRGRLRGKQKDDVVVVLDHVHVVCGAMNVSSAPQTTGQRGGRRHRLKETRGHGVEASCAVLFTPATRPGILPYTSQRQA